MSPQQPTIRIRPADICACFGRHLVAAFIVSTLRSWGKSVKDGIWPGEEGGGWGGGKEVGKRAGEGATGVEGGQRPTPGPSGRHLENATGSAAGTGGSR